MNHTYITNGIRLRKAALSGTAIGGIALALSLASGSTFNAFAKDLRSAFSPLSLLFVSEILTAFFVLFSFGFLPVIKKIVKLKKKELRWLLVMGTLSGIAGPMLWFTALGYTTAVNAGFFGKTEIITLMLFAHFLLGEKLTRAHSAAMITIVTGIVIISLRGFTQGLSLYPGDFIIIAATSCYAFSNILYRKKVSHVAPHIALFMRSSTAIAAFFLISPFIQHPFIEEVLAFPVALIPALIGFGFVSRFLNSVMYYQAIELLPISTVSLVGSLDIIGTTVFAYFYLGEPVVWYQYAGGAFIILGTVLLELLGTHKNKEHLEKHLKHRMR